MTTDNDAKGIEDGNDVSLNFHWDSPQSLLEKPPLTAGSVNKIKGHALQSCLFKQLCNDNDEVLDKLIMQTKVRWLSKKTV